jgi:hypothetical protein
MWAIRSNRRKRLKQEKLVHARVKAKIPLYGCQNPALGSRFHYHFQFVVRMDDFGFFAGTEKSAHHDSLGNRRYDISPDAVSVVVAQIPQSLSTIRMVEKAFNAASSDFLSVANDTSDYWNITGSFY